MTDKDFVIESQMRVPEGSIISAKPYYLITLTEKSGKGKKEEQRRFIALDLPRMEMAHVQTKGIYVDATEEKILEDFRALIQETPRDQITELFIPWHSIINIRSLVFKAKN